MLYKFKSKATGDLIMLEANGRRVLEIMGKLDAASNKGILLPEDMAAAMAALQAAVVQEEAALEAAKRQAQAENHPVPHQQGVSLRQRVQPMVEMLRRCAAAQEPMVWGV